MVLEKKWRVRSDQVRSQAGAHGDHIKYVLNAQESESKRKHDNAWDEELSKERSAHQKS